MKGKRIDPRKTAEGSHVLYHGTKLKFDNFETSTGLEKMDVTKGGVVYFTSDIETAKRYAGPDGYVCIAEIEEPIDYAEQRRSQGLPKKQNKYTRNVYVALPIDVKITGFKRVSELD